MAYFTHYFYTKDGKPMERAGKPFPTKEQAYDEALSYWAVEYALNTDVRLQSFEVHQCEEQCEVDEEYASALLSECERRDGVCAALSERN